MVGPLSSEEIEDVVSSVRRLVSNELRPRTLSRDPAADRLLLTAALRVVPDSSPLAPLVLDAPLVEATIVAADLSVNVAAVEEGAPPPGDTSAPVPEAASGVTVGGPTVVAAEPVAEIEPDLTPIPLDTEEKREPAAEPLAEAPDEAAAAEGTGQDDRLEADEAVWESGLWVEPAPASLGEVALAAEEAEVLIGSAGGEFPADGGEAEAALPRDGGEAEKAGTGVDEPVPFVSVHRRAEQTAGHDAAAAPHEVSGQPGGAAGNMAAPGPAPTEFVDVDGMPLAVLDEAALQEIVRQTLRAELQGELGERITRNIRKLVRAEINRAFVARDLD
ncbi:MAG: hypothetical protein ACK40I_08005 [Tabrizicola sp.]